MNLVTFRVSGSVRELVTAANKIEGVEVASVVPEKGPRMASAKDAAKIYAAYEKGKTAKAVGAMFGVSDQTVGRIALNPQSYGLEKPPIRRTIRGRTK